MLKNANDAEQLNALRLPLVLPHGAKALKRRLVWGVGAGILVEHFRANIWTKHSHAHWQVVVMFSPAVCEVVTWTSSSRRRKPRLIRGCQIWIMPPGWLHSVRWRVSADAIVLYVEPERIPESLQGHLFEFSVKPLADYVAAQPNVAELCSELRYLCLEPDDMVEWRIAGAGTLLTALLVEAHATLMGGGLMPHTGLARQILEKMKQQIAAQGTERVRIIALARSLGMSPRHFRRIVRRITGKSPQDLVTLFKIQAAKNLLKGGTHNVSEAAYATGFSDPAHLNRRMHAIYGVSPKAFLPRLPPPFQI